MVTGSLNMADLRERLPALYHSKVVLTAFAFFASDQHEAGPVSVACWLPMRMRMLHRS
jgi:hypothetical protein